MPLSHVILKLIYSLNEWEKRNFTQFSQYQRDKKEYLNLYNQLNQKIRKSNDFPKKDFPEIKGIKNLSRAKINLQEALFRSLRFKYEKSSIENQLNCQIHDAFLLRKRGLSLLSYDYLQKTKLEAIKYEQFHLVLSVIDKQLSLAMNNLKKGMMEKMLGLHQEKKEALNNILMEEEFMVLRHNAFLLFRRDNNLRKKETAEEVENLFKILFKKIAKATTFFSKNHLHDALALLYRLKRKPEDAVSEYEKILHLWEKESAHTHFKFAFPDLYKIHIYNYLNTILRLKRYDIFDEKLKEVSQYSPRFLEEEVEDYQNIEFLRFLKYMNTGQWEEAKAMAPEIGKKLKHYSRKMEVLIESRKISWLYNIGVLYFVLEDFREAESWFIEIITQTLGKEQRLDIQYLSRILILIVYYEKGAPHDEKLLEESTTKFLKRNQTYLDFEKIVITNLRKLRNLRNDYQDINGQLRDFSKELKSLKKNSPIRNGLEEIELWISNKLGKNL